MSDRVLNNGENIDDLNNIIYEYAIMKVMEHYNYDYEEVADMSMDDDFNNILNVFQDEKRLEIIETILKDGVRKGDLGDVDFDTAEDVLTLINEWKNDVNDSFFEVIRETINHNFLYSNNKDIIMEGLNNGADINAKMDFPFNPLRYYCNNDNLKMAELLLENGADIEDVVFDEDWKILNNDTCDYVKQEYKRQQALQSKEKINDNLQEILDKVDNREKAFNSNMEETKQEQEKPQMTHKRKM